MTSVHQFNLRRVIRAMRKGYVLMSCVLSVHFINLASSCVYEIIIEKLSLNIEFTELASLNIKFAKLKV